MDSDGLYLSHETMNETISKAAPSTEPDAAAAVSCYSTASVVRLRPGRGVLVQARKLLLNNRR